MVSRQRNGSQGERRQRRVCRGERAGSIGRLNAWGLARDRDMLGRRGDLGASQVGVSATFQQAQEALLVIVTDFRLEAVALRQLGQNEAAAAWLLFTSTSPRYRLKRRLRFPAWKQID